MCPLDIQLDTEIIICLSYRNNSRFCLYASFDESWPKVLVLTITFGFGLAKLDPKIKSNPAAKIFCATHNFVQCWDFDKQIFACWWWDAADADCGIARVDRARRARVITTSSRCIQVATGRYELIFIEPGLLHRCGVYTHSSIPPVYTPHRCVCYCIIVLKQIIY